MKIIKFFIFMTLLIVAGLSLTFAFQRSHNEHFLLGRCTLWDSNYDPIYQFPGSYCQVVPNEGVAIKRDTEIYFNNTEGVNLFQIPGLFHHDVNYSQATKTIYALNAKDYLLENGENALIAGIIGFNTKGEITFNLEGERILDFFKQINVDLSPYYGHSGTEWLNQAGAKSKKYLLFANNIQFVPEDILGTHYKKDNILLNILEPSGFLLVDHNTSEIKEWFPYYSHDLQGEESHRPTIDGENVIVYLNRVVTPEGLRSKVASYDLKTKKRNWIWPTDDSQFHFYSPTHGGLFKAGTDRFVVYSLYDKFMLELNTTSFTHRYLISPDSPKLNALRDGKLFVALKVIPKSYIENFNFFKKTY